MVGKQDHEMNFTAVQSKSVLKGGRQPGIDEKSTGILRLEKNCGFTLLCTWMIQFRRYCEPRLTCGCRKAIPFTTVHSAARHAPLQMNGKATLSLSRKSWFYPGDDLSLTFLFSPFHPLWIRPYATCGSRHNAIMRVGSVAQDFKGERARFRAAT